MKGIVVMFIAKTITMLICPCMTMIVEGGGKPTKQQQLDDSLRCRFGRSQVPLLGAEWAPNLTIP